MQLVYCFQIQIFYVNSLHCYSLQVCKRWIQLWSRWKHNILCIRLWFWNSVRNSSFLFSASKTGSTAIFHNLFNVSVVNLINSFDLFAPVKFTTTDRYLNARILCYNFRCFLALLLVAAILWKIKQKYDRYRRRQRLFVEMEQMASRPFGTVLVELEKLPTLPSGGNKQQLVEIIRLIFEILRFIFTTFHLLFNLLIIRRYKISRKYTFQSNVIILNDVNNCSYIQY